MTKCANKIQTTKSVSRFEMRSEERGAALTIALILMALIAGISLSVLAVVSTEARIAGSDLQRTQTFYAAAAGIEKMTSDFSALFARTSRPTLAQLNNIAASYPPELINEGFSFTQILTLDTKTLNAMRATQGITDGSYPRVTIPSGPFAGLVATVSPYLLASTATKGATGTEVRLQREMNNYLIPLFQFGIFSDEDIELHPGPQFYFNGRIHANGNVYANGNVQFLNKVTTANEIVTDVLRNGIPRIGNVWMKVGPTNVQLTQGSVFSGPNFPSARIGERGYFPGSPNGTANRNWESTSVAAPRAGTPNQFGGQLQTRTTGASPLLLPIQLERNPTREIIKRRMPNDNGTMSEARYHNKAQIRILLDDENVTSDASAIPPGKGVNLSQFTPVPLGSGRALWRIKDDGSYLDTSTTAVRQGSVSGPQADTVRGVKPTSETSPTSATIPHGAGITGRIFIEIVAPSGATYDVTTQILSMGMTEGEPNGIVYLQRPLWAAFTQGSRDRSGGNNSLTYLMDNTSIGSQGEIKTAGAGFPTMDSNYGFFFKIADKTPGGQPPVREDSPSPTSWNRIVPINIYNVREGLITSAWNANNVYERGITSIVEINMRNLARWVDGVYDNNLLAGTNAVSANINGSEGYIVYISDRRGDKVKSEIDTSGASVTSTNGMVDNEDIYGPNGRLDPGEDVIDARVDVGTGQPKKGTLQKDTTELPDQGAVIAAGTTMTTRLNCAVAVASWTNPNNYFRRAVRLFNGENLQITGASGKLSTTKGITIATENMIYTWGNYNTTGINGQPSGGSTLNDPTQTYYYLGNQVPTSIVADAFMPLSKTWFDSSGAMFPDNLGRRPADANLSSAVDETSVRSGIIAGNNLSALSGTPDAGNSSDGESRLNGGVHNFPRFLENWGNRRWNFVGALIPLYHSTQAMRPYNAYSTIYSPPIRNWAFDETFKDPNRLPPGTPSFQYIEPTGFRQEL